MRYKEPFTLYARKMKNGKPVWYYRVYDSDGNRTSGKSTGLTSKTVTKALLGLLNKRNECAHPSEYYPGLTETLGYVTELLQRIEAIRKRSI